MITENLSTLKIHKLTEAQYKRELAAGRIDENALYLTPYEDCNLTEADKEEIVQLAEEIVDATANSLISAHNTATDAHADIRAALNNKLSSSELQTAINTSLAQAKASGEFDGADGKDGLDATPVTPLFANSVDECTDTSKPYVLPDGFIYTYMLTETEGGAGYTNLVPTSTDTDGSIYNGTGYKDDARLSGGSGGVSGYAQNGSVVTGFIPFKAGDIIRIKGAEWLNASANIGGHYYLSFYDSGKKYYESWYVSSSEYGSDGGNYAGDISIVYDSTSGVTTFAWVDPSRTSGLTGRITDAKYFRINAYGKGSDLIVTVNQEIKEAGSSIVYTWKNTGHAFVPANYENRIVELEESVEDVDARITDLKQQVEDILDGTTEIAASTKFDPTVYRLPILYLTGDTTGMTKETEVTLSYKCNDKDGIAKAGSCTMKWQGSSSLAWDKKNYTIKFDNAFEVVDGWGSQKKYCLKANWIDCSHSRNVVSAKLWGLIRKNRSNLPTQLKVLPNAGAIDGFPVVVMLNGEFHGLYSWNIPKDAWMFGMGSGTKEAIVGADNQADDTAFKAETLLDADGWELEYNSSSFTADAVKTSLNNLIKACIDSLGGDLDTTVAQYLDWESAIDYYIFATIIQGGDMITKNTLLATFDGVKWYFSAYDMDTTYGLAFDGSGLARSVTTSHTTFETIAETHRVFELIKRFKTNELKARYNALRTNELSESRICNYFENYAWDISSPILVEEVKKWPSVRGSSVNGIDQICRWVRQRLEVTDKWIEEL